VQQPQKDVSQLFRPTTSQRNEEDDEDTKQQIAQKQRKLQVLRLGAHIVAE
jgi:hypothetical protein